MNCHSSGSKKNSIKKKRLVILLNALAITPQPQHTVGYCWFATTATAFYAFYGRVVKSNYDNF